ncbi:hypothetical protein BDW59DRAFT_179040 [Aspergillus cavernicola]|uniref:NmrA-like domain-containing protein n=1 Tax=Aspergillus cavernicola TaxID=176166 RepID=A0ABR4IJM5_9EURO
MSKTIAIVGTTGNQGSSVAHTFLKSPSWSVRALTRNPSSPSAQKLVGLGAEVVQADLSDINSLAAAFNGAHAIFVNTDFWGPYVSGSPSGAGTHSSDDAFNDEVTHGKNAAIAASRIPTLERFVYSALGPIKRASAGKYTQSYHWDSKASIVDYIESEQVELAKKTSYIYLGAYATNPLFMPRLDPSSGVYQFVLPFQGGTKIPVIDAAGSTGSFVRELIESEAPGTKLLAYDSYLSINELVDVWAKATGEKAELVSVSVEYLNSELGIPWEVLEAPRFIEEVGYMGGIEGWVGPRGLREEVKTRSFEGWLRERDWKGDLERGEVELGSVKNK